MSPGPPLLSRETRVRSRVRDRHRSGGGPDRVRTDDLLDANQALSQLSYGPVSKKPSRPFLALKDLRDPGFRDVFQNRIDFGALFKHQRKKALTIRHLF